VNEPSLDGLGIRLESLHGGQFGCPDDPIRPRLSVTLEEARLLAVAAAGLRVLEFGTGVGVSALYMAILARQLVTIDPDPWVHENVNLPASVIRVAHFDEVSPGGFDLAFIDGAHDQTSVERDIRDARTRMASGDVIAFHDSQHTGVRLAIEAKAHVFGAMLTLPTLGKLTFARIV